MCVYVCVCGNIALLTSVVSMICSLYFSPFPVPPSPVKVTCCATWPCTPVAIAIDGNQKLVGDPATDLLVEPTSEGVDLCENEGGWWWGGGTMSVINVVHVPPPSLKKKKKAETEREEYFFSFGYLYTCRGRLHLMCFGR